MAHRILIVEDNESVRGCLQELLRLSGYEVEVAATVEEALGLISRRSYSLVFTDLNLGGPDGLDGMDVLRKIRQTSPSTRTVILSGRAHADMKGRALSQRADAFLLKPVGMRELRELAAQLLGSAPLIA